MLAHAGVDKYVDVLGLRRRGGWGVGADRLLCLVRLRASMHRRRRGVWGVAADRLFDLGSERFRDLNEGLVGRVGFWLEVAEDNGSSAARRGSGVGAAPWGRRGGRERKRRRRKRGLGRLKGGEKWRHSNDDRSDYQHNDYGWLEPKWLRIFWNPDFDRFLRKSVKKHIYVQKNASCAATLFGTRSLSDFR